MMIMMDAILYKTHFRETELCETDIFHNTVKTHQKGIRCEIL